MNNRLLFVLLCFLSTAAFAQNKSLGVGTVTPNPNAALDVSSPTNNQGALMPRLTTAQRTAMAGILGAADAGLLLYDADLKGLYIWNGTAWESSAKVRYPQVDTLSTLPPNGNALRIVYNGTDVGNFGVAHFENLNPNSGFSAIFGRTNSATNGVADFIVNNPSNTNDALGVNTNAINGRAGAFNLNNAGSRNHALYAQSNGDSTGSALHGNNIGNGFGVFGKSAGSKFASAAVYGEHVGTGDAAGAFRITNPGNTYAALYGETNGSGSALFANNLGTVGRGGQIQINNAANPNAALRAFTNGTGNAGFFTINNVVNDSSALYITTNGTGNAITANAPIKATQFIGDGSGLVNLPPVTIPFTSNNTNAPNNSNLFNLSTNASISTDTVYVARFENQNPSAYSDILSVLNLGQGAGGYFQIGDFTNTTGSGAAVFGAQLGLGRAGQFQIQNPANSQPAIRGFTNGTGRAGFFSISNPANDAAAIMGETNGVGAAIFGINSGPGDSFSPAGHFIVNNPTNTHAAVQGNNSGNGPAGSFFIESAGNSSSAIISNTIGIGAAGDFNIDNATSGAAALNGSTNGTGAAIQGTTSTGFASVYGRREGATNGNAGLFEITDAGNSFPSLDAKTQGTGPAANFVVNNIAANQPGLNVLSNSNTGGAPGSAGKFEATGNARALTVEINNAGNSSRAFSSTHAGLGRAGHFETTNGGNTEPTILAQSNGTNSALRINQSNSNLAIEITAGGVSNSVFTTGTPGTINNKVGIVNITTAGTYTIGTAGRVNGETIVVTSEVVADIVDIDLGGGWFVRLTDINQASTLVFVNGNWRGTGAIQP